MEKKIELQLVIPKVRMFTEKECNKIKQAEIFMPKVSKTAFPICDIFNQKHNKGKKYYFGLYELLFGTFFIGVNGELDKDALEFFPYDYPLSTDTGKFEIHDIYHQLTKYADKCVNKGFHYKAAICYAILVEFSSKDKILENLDGLAMCFENLNAKDIAVIVRTKKIQFQLPETIYKSSIHEPKEAFKNRVQLDPEQAKSIEFMERTTAEKVRRSKDINNIANVHAILELDVVSCFDESLMNASIERIHQEYKDRLVVLQSLLEKYQENSELAGRLNQIILNTKTVDAAMNGCKENIQAFYAPFNLENITKMEQYELTRQNVVIIQNKITTIKSELSQNYKIYKDKNKLFEQIQGVEGEIVSLSLDTYRYQQELLRNAANQLSDELPWGGFLLYSISEVPNELNLMNPNNKEIINQKLNGRDAIILQADTHLYHARYSSGIESTLTITSIADKSESMRKMFDGDEYTRRKPISSGGYRLATRHEYDEILSCLGQTFKPWDAHKDRDHIREDYIIVPMIADLNANVKMGHLHKDSENPHSYESIVKITYGDNSNIRYFKKERNSYIRTDNTTARECYSERYPNNPLNQAVRDLENDFIQLEKPFEQGFHALVHFINAKFSEYETNNKARFFVTPTSEHTGSIASIRREMRRVTMELYSVRLEKLIAELIKHWGNVHLAHLYPDDVYRQRIIDAKGLGSEYEEAIGKEIKAYFKGYYYSKLEKALLEVIYSLPSNQVLHGWHSYNFDFRKIMIETPLDGTFGGYKEKFEEGIGNAGPNSTLRVKIAVLLREYSKSSNVTHKKLAESLATEFLAIECAPADLRQRITTVFHQLLANDKAFMTKPGRFFYLLQFAIQTIDSSMEWENNKLKSITNHNQGVEAHDPEFGGYREKFELWLKNTKQGLTLADKMIWLLKEYSACYGIHKQKTFAQNLEVQFDKPECNTPEKIAEILKESIASLNADKTYNSGLFYHLLHFALQYVNRIISPEHAGDNWELLGDEPESISFNANNEENPQVLINNTNDNSGNHAVDGDVNNGHQQANNGNEDLGENLGERDSYNVVI